MDEKGLKAVILIYLSLLFFGNFIPVGALQVGTIEKAFPFISKIYIFLYYFCAGAIGSSLRHLYMFCSHYMKDELNEYKA